MLYQTPQRKKAKLALALSTSATRKGKNSDVIIASSSDDSTSEDEHVNPSLLKYLQLNTRLSDLAQKPRELLDIITTSKQLVKYIKVLIKNSRQKIHHLSFQYELLSC